jgi:Zn-dependent protease
VNESVIQAIAVYAIPVLYAITLHEVAHGWAARHFGDQTAAQLGRLSLNPLKHIDPIGTVVMPLVLYFMTSGAFVFGYAKPVPVSIMNLRNPKRDMLWVAFAGPGSNLAMALLWMLFAVALAALGVREPFVVRMAEAGVAVNFVMAALNLFPLPPLDGGRMLASLLPIPQANLLLRLEPFGFLVVLVLAGTHLLDYWMGPILTVLHVGLRWLMLPLLSVLS